MLNLDVDGYTKPQIILRKMQKDDNLLKTNKRILKPKYKLSGSLVFTFSLPGELKLSVFRHITIPLQQTL